MMTSHETNLLDLRAKVADLLDTVDAIIDAPPPTKPCAWCGDETPFPEGFQKCGSGNYRPECKFCSNAAAKIRRLTPKSQRLAAARRRNRRARLKGADMDGHTAEELVVSWAERGLYSCVYCHAEWEHVDHMVPLALGGAHTLGNLVPACADCNTRKGAMDPWEFLEEMGLLERARTSMVITPLPEKF